MDDSDLIELRCQCLQERCKSFPGSYGHQLVFQCLPEAFDSVQFWTVWGNGIDQQSTCCPSFQASMKGCACMVGRVIQYHYGCLKASDTFMDYQERVGHARCKYNDGAEVRVARFRRQGKLIHA